MSHHVVPASQGSGPLLQRDYWAVLADYDGTPAQLMAHVKTNFCELPPEALVRFDAPHGVATGAELEIVITPVQPCRVRVVHEDAQSITLGTLEGHPEAGRITFGAYRNDNREVLFHIRSRARSSSAVKLLGFLTIGEAMQTNTWTDFINRTAVSAGARIRDVIHAETETVEDEEDDSTVESPTFLATGN